VPAGPPANDGGSGSMPALEVLHLQQN
jgi:hypothetical protein